MLAIETITGRGSGKSVEDAIKSAKRRIYVVSPYISSEYAKLLLRKAINGVEVFIVTLKGKREFSTALLLLYSGKVSKEDVERVENYRKRLITAIYASMAIYIVLIALVIVSLLVFENKYWVYLLSTPLIGLVCSVFFYAGLVEYAILAALIPIVLLFGTIYFDISRPELYIYTFFWFLVAAFPAIMLLPLFRVSFTRAYRGIIQELGPPRRLVNVRFFEDSKTYVHSKIYIIDDVGFSGSLNLTISSIKRNVETITIYRGEDVEKIEKDFWKIWNMLSDPTINVFFDVYSSF